MIIANPLYDVVFKSLMEDNRIATFFLETLLEEKIESLEVNTTEQTVQLKDPMMSKDAWEKMGVERLGINLIRLDFVATIELKTGGTKKVLIEIQKARKPIDVMRFRNYLAEHYKKEDEIMVDGKKARAPLPIITIYLLGFPLPEIEVAAVKVDRNYVDLQTKSIINTKSDFIEKLTHDCFVVQLPRIERRFQTTLDRLLTVFEQRYFLSSRDETLKRYEPVEENEEMITRIVDALYHRGADPEKRKELDDEKETERVLALYRNEDAEMMQQKLEQNEVLLKSQSETIEHNQKEIEHQHQFIDVQNKKLEEKDNSLKEKDKLIEALQKQLNKDK
jgi:hypothetical protein